MALNPSNSSNLEQLALTGLITRSEKNTSLSVEFFMKFEITTAGVHSQNDKFEYSKEWRREA